MVPCCMPDESGFEGKIGVQYQEAFFDTGWAATKLNESYIRRFLQLAAAKPHSGVLGFATVRSQAPGKA